MTLNAPVRDDARVNRHWWWLLLVLLLALALRLIRLGTFAYWHDEVHNLIASEDLHALVFHGILISNHPPLPYILVAFWRAMGLDGSEWTMRLLPVIFGVGGVAAVYALGRRLFGARAGLFGAFLLAISPLHVHHSQDLKEYIYLPCVAAVMVLWFYRAMDSNRMRDWLVYGVLAGLACYTEIFVGPLLAAINLWAVFQIRSKPGLGRGWLAGNMVGALLFLPWLGIMCQKAVKTMIDATNWWVPPPSLIGVGFYFKAVAFGYTAIKPWFKVAFVLYLVLVTVGFVQAFRVNRKGALLLAMWAVIPVGIVYGVSLITQSIFLIRAMLTYAVALYILAGVGLAYVRPRWLQAGMLGLVCVVAGVGLFHEYKRDYPPLDFPHRPGTHPPRDYSGAARYILAHWQDGDIVVHSADATWLPFHWYGFRGMPNYFGGRGAKFIEGIKIGNPRNTTDPILENYWPQEPQRIVPGAKRIWFVFAEWERKYLIGNAMNMYRWLDARFTEVENHAFRGIDILLYVPPESVTPIARDKDDGVSVVITHAGDIPGAYRKTQPDPGVVARPIEERRGRLTLAFDNEPRGTAVRLAGAGPTRTVGFSVENRAGVAVPCHIDLVVSDALVDLARLDEDDPERGVWTIGTQYNGTPPPREYDFCVANANTSTASDTLRGEAVFPAGVFTPLVYVFGTPEDRAAARGRWDLWVGGTNLFAPPLRNRPDVQGWQWVIGPPITIPDSAGTTPVRIEAGPTPGLSPSYVSAAYLALVKSSRLPAEPHSSLVYTPWPGDVTIPAGQQVYRASAEIDADAPRVDIWVYERTENGRVYRVFQSTSRM